MIQRKKEMISTDAPLSHRDFLRIDKDYEAAARVANLVYVSDQQAGIKRIKKGKGFIFSYENVLISEPKELERIKSLAIPPAWTKVWICKSTNAHIQATGYDVRGRKQYKYHPAWSALQQETKFHRMYEFGKALPLLRKKIKKDISQHGFPESKVLATMISLMEKTYIRIGNNGYEKLYGSFGLTTLKNKHVSIKGDSIMFSFKGKKGIYHNIALKSKKFCRIIKQCKAIPGKELFQYYDESGNLKKVDSGQVNQYIKNCLQRDFTTKDFRTWAGTLMMLRALKSSPPCSTIAEYQQNVVNAFKEVSKNLGNTVAVCKKYYVHPQLIEYYEKNKISDLLSNTASLEAHGLAPDEKSLMKFLRIQKQHIKHFSVENLLTKSVQKENRKARKVPSNA